MCTWATQQKAPEAAGFSQTPCHLDEASSQSQRLPLSTVWGCLLLLHPLPCRAALFPHREVPAAPRSWTRPLIDLIQWLWSSWSSSNIWARSCCQTWSAEFCVWILRKQCWSLGACSRDLNSSDQAGGKREGLPYTPASSLKLQILMLPSFPQ